MMKLANNASYIHINFLKMKQLNNQISKNKIYGNTTYEQHSHITKPEATSNNIH